MLNRRNLFALLAGVAALPLAACLTQPNAGHHPALSDDGLNATRFPNVIEKRSVVPDPNGVRGAQIVQYSYSYKSPITGAEYELASYGNRVMEWM